MSFRTLLAGLCLLPLAAAVAQAPLSPYEQALARARAQKAPLLIDFHAPWCYSCYYMAQKVLTGPEWESVERKTVVLALDADDPQGAAVMKQWGIKALPSYLVLDSDGRELGRILGEQTRADFYAKLGEIGARGATLEALAAQVRDGGSDSVNAAREVLRSYHARFDAGGGLAWLAALPKVAHAAIETDAVGGLWLQRLRLMQAQQQGDAPACLASGPPVLAGDLGCERAYELDRYVQACAGASAQKEYLLAAQRPALERLLADGVFGARPCADERSVVLVAADLFQALGDGKAEAALLQRAVAQAQQRIGPNLRQDRNGVDNLRVYLERAGRTAELDALLLRLIEAYPDDYVYAYRHGRNLVARGAPAQALPFLEQAAARAYGVNRIRVAEQRVMALKALKRDLDARRVVAEALKANGPWFPEDAAKLKALLRG